MSFLGRIGDLFRARPADPEGWQIGDWAECVRSGQWVLQPVGRLTAGPRLGSVMKVIGVKICRDPSVEGGRVLALAFAGWPGEFFQADHFRKLNPRADEATPAETAFTDLVRRTPRPAQPVPLPVETIEEFQ